MPVTITLTLPYDLSANQWAAVDAVFRGMDGWIGYSPDGTTPQWFGSESDKRYVWASVEPSGLLVAGDLEPGLWTGWISVLCARLSLALGIEVRDAEM